MSIVKGAFNDLLRPGLKRVYEEYSASLLDWAFRKVPAVSRLKGLSRLSLKESEEYPPKDWPDYP